MQTHPFLAKWYVSVLKGLGSYLLLTWWSRGWIGSRRWRKPETMTSRPAGKLIPPSRFHFLYKGWSVKWHLGAGGAGETFGHVAEAQRASNVMGSSNIKDSNFSTFLNLPPLPMLDISNERSVSEGEVFTNCHTCLYGSSSSPYEEL